MIKPCPFCNSLALGVSRLDEDREGYPTQVLCYNCGCNGPWVYLKYVADRSCLEHVCELTGWNKRGE